MREREKEKEKTSVCLFAKHDAMAAILAQAIPQQSSNGASTQ